MEKVANFVGNIFMEHPSYLHLRHFDNVFSTFSKKGVVVSSQHTLIERLAAHPQDSLERWLPNHVDVIDRNCFTNSRLYISYNEHVCQLLLNKAQEQFQQNNTREGLNFLSEALAAASCENVSPGFRQTAEFATMVFGAF